MGTRENFRTDLSWGEKWERVVGLYLSMNGLSSISYNNDYKYDIKGTQVGGEYTYEIKSDRYPNTGNMAIEIRDAGRPSGISKTEADVFIYNYTNLDDRAVYLCFIPVKDLKQLIRDNFDKLKIIKGGDNKEAEIILLPMKKFKSYFKVKTLKRKNWDLPE